jgi:hypothetical protein
MSDSSQYPECEFCSSHAVVKAVAVVNNKVLPQTPLCADCHVPLPDLGLPEGTHASELMDEGGLYEPSLITSPADTVLRNGNTVIIKHGPGDESRITLPSYE